MNVITRKVVIKVCGKIKNEKPLKRERATANKKYALFEVAERLGSFEAALQVGFHLVEKGLDPNYASDETFEAAIAALQVVAA